MEKQGYFTKAITNSISVHDSFEPMTVEGKTVYDSGNEEYIVLLIDFKEYNENIDDYNQEIQTVTEVIEEVLEKDFPYDKMDHAITLEKVTHGNHTIIALITCCK